MSIAYFPVEHEVFTTHNDLYEIPLVSMTQNNYDHDLNI